MEALRSRGHTAELFTGSDAREALLAADERSLRVLLVPEGLDADQIATLERGLDPTRLGNVLVTALDRAAPDMAERIESFARAVAITRRASRPAIVNLNLPEPATPQPRTWLPPLAVAGAIALVTIVALQYGLRRDDRPDEGMPDVVPAAAAVGQPPPPELELEAEPDAPITVSVEPTEEEEIEIFDIERARRPRTRKPEPVQNEPPPPVANVGFDAPLPEVPGIAAPSTLRAPAGPNKGPVPGEEHLLQP